MLFAPQMGATCANLAGRVYNAAHIAFSIMKWEGDCCILQLPRMKKDQGGSKTIDRHVYVNPKDPRGWLLFWLGLRNSK